MASKGWCTLCRVHTTPAHWRTKSHGDRAWRHDHPKATRQRAWHRRSSEQYSLASVERVRAHRRSRPGDGSPKVVRVRRYFRGRRGAY